MMITAAGTLDRLRFAYTVCGADTDTSVAEEQVGAGVGGAALLAGVVALAIGVRRWRSRPAGAAEESLNAQITQW